MKIEEIINKNSYNKIDIRVNSQEGIINGIVFLYTSWSIDQRYLKVLLDCLVEKKATLPLYVYDSEHETYKIFENQYNLLSQGKGEIYLILNKKLITKIESHDSVTPERKINLLLDKVE